MLCKEVNGAPAFLPIIQLTPTAGVTVVQYRDKTNDTGLLVETARKLHQITKKYNVPLLINDRVDVALAIGAEGVHLGQDDMSSLLQFYKNICINVKYRLRGSKEASSRECHYWYQYVLSRGGYKSHRRWRRLYRNWYYVCHPHVSPHFQYANTHQ